MSVSFRAAELLVGRLPPFVASGVRSQALRAAGVRLGATSIFWDFPTLLGRVEQLQVGEFCGFNTGCFLLVMGQQRISLAKWRTTGG